LSIPDGIALASDLAIHLAVVGREIIVGDEVGVGHHADL
jgi:hypothetical protein